jgi:hypothetical protein
MVPLLVPNAGRNQDVGMLLNIFKIDVAYDPVYLSIHNTL